MPLNLCNYDQQARAAVKGFWQTRDAARQKQQASGKADQGERAGVTGGKNMDGFANLVIDLVKANGLAHRLATTSTTAPKRPSAPRTIWPRPTAKARLACRSARLWAG